MILHIMISEKFAQDYIDRINKLYGEDEHFFLVYPPKTRYLSEGDIELKNVLFLDLKQSHKMLKSLIMQSERIILHSLFLGILDLRFFYRTIKQYGKHFVWVVWGGDLYNLYKYNHSLAIFKIKPLINEYYRKKIIKNFGTIVTGSDWEEIQKRYVTTARKTSAQYVYHFLEDFGEKKHDDYVKVMVGHSATETCQHEKAFRELVKYKGRVKIICPLSYPKNERYVSKVNKLGFELFGEDYKPILEFMEYSQYVSLLNDIDIGVFNNSRQQGMGNITNLLFLGKKVYISEKNTIWKIYDKAHYEIYGIEEIKNDDFLTPLSAEEKKRNKENIQYKFSDEKFKSDWDVVFYG